MAFEPAPPVAFDRVANRNAAIRWGALVLGFLGLSIGMGVTAIALASRDPSVAVIPDYYDRALAWDQMQHLRQQSEELGWQLDTSVASPATLVITLRDRDGQGIVIDHGTLRLFHHARANQIRTEKLRGLEDGVIRVPGAITRAGLWQVDIDVTSIDRKRFVRTWDEKIIGEVVP